MQDEDVIGQLEKQLSEL